MPSSRRVLVLIVLAFVALGMPMQAMGVAWPTVAADLGRPLGNLGILVFAFGVGYGVSTYSSGHLSWRVGAASLLTGATATSAVCLVVMAAGNTWTVLVTATLVFGLGSGLLDAGGNAYVALNHGTRAMGMLHAGWGVGSILGPGLVTLLLAVGASWRWSFALVALAQAAVASRFAREARRSERVGRASDEARPPRPGGTDAVLAVSVVTFMLYAGLATATGQWAFSVLSEGRGISEGVAGIAASGYWAGFTASRFLLGAVGSRLEPNRLLTACTIATVASLGLFWWAPTPAVGIFGLVFSGFAHGAFYPVEVLLTARRFGSAYTPWALGYCFAAANVGVAGLGAVLGLLVDGIGLEVVAPVLLLASVILAVTTRALERLTGAAAPVMHPTQG
jgi:fucose permease